MKALVFAVFALLVLGFSCYSAPGDIAYAPAYDDDIFGAVADESQHGDDGSLAGATDETLIGAMTEVPIKDGVDVGSGDGDSDSNSGGDSDSNDYDYDYNYGYGYDRDSNDGDYGYNVDDASGNGGDAGGDYNNDYSNGAESGADGDTGEPASALGDIVVLKISAAGDTTLGGDPRGSGLFIREFERHGSDHSHFLRNVRDIFEEDDLTIVNLEGTLTDATEHLDKTYALRGPPHFSKILSSSGVDAVTLANNHSRDYLERGYKDTIASLEDEGIAYFGESTSTILEINGIRVGLFGFSVLISGRNYERIIAKAIGDLQERDAQLIIAYYHWGIERSNIPESSQRALGRFSIDNGADLVLGSHPHVLQGIEEYKGRYIVYSLANFCFGANNNPADHDTFIFQQSFTFENGVLLDKNETNIIPVLISSEKGRNNFQPMVADGDDAERIMQRIRTYSDWLVH